MIMTAITSDGVTFYIGHENKVDISGVPALVATPTIDVGSPVNGLATDGTYLYVACDAGLKSL